MKNILEFQQNKISQKKMSMITCYDYSFARLVDNSDIDCVLVGDSLGMTILGHSNTLKVSTDMMAIFTEAVVKGAPSKFVIADMPFLSYRKSLSENVSAAEVLMKAGAHAVKLEGAAGNLELIRHLVDSGVPVMAHLGLTPQSIHQLGGFKVQGRDLEAQRVLSEHSLAVQKAGAFALVLECVPASLAKKITQELAIPTIGIGAGIDCDGQVLVLQDLLGMNQDFKPKFLKTYANGAEFIIKAFDQFHKEVINAEFPTEKESYL